MINNSEANYLYIISLNELSQPKICIYWNHEKMEKIVNIHMIVNDIHNHKFTIHKLDGAEFLAISSVDHIFH